MTGGEEDVSFEPGGMRDHRLPPSPPAMIRSLFFRVLVPLAAAGWSLGAPSEPAPAVRPNIVFILTDDMGFGDVGCYGGKFAPTPNIDRMATEGIRFTQYYSAAPICSPSRAGLTTGMCPARWHITSYLQTRAGNRACEQADFLDAAAPSLARALKAAGYATGHFGKWHMGGGRDVKNAPGFEAYGFDEHASTWESPDPHPDITATNWIWSDQDKVKRWDRTAFFVDKTLDFLRRHQGQPCYVNLWPDDTHTPWVPSQERLGQYPSGPEEERKFRAVLDEYDRQIGRLLDGIKQLGIDERTLVIFSSDNGPLPSFRGSRSGGLRGSKLSLYEGGIRMPFLVRWPGQVPAGGLDEKTVLSALDLFPSLCKLAGAALPAGPSWDGEDLSAALLGKPAARRKPLLWEYGRDAKSFAYPEGRDKSPNVAVRDGQWKLLVNADGSDVQLYDLAADRNETTNLAPQRPKITARLQERALAWRKEVGASAGAPEPAAAAAAGSRTRPNIVMFLCDDLGLLDCEPYGATDVRTPNLKRLAAEGLVFNRAFIASPACAPSRAAMLSGLMPARNGAEPNHSYAKPGTLGWPHYLNELGYETAAFGKVAHLDDVKRWEFSRFDKKFDPGMVRAFLNQRAGGKPLCLFVGTNDPHVPWDKNKDYDPAKVKLPANFVDTPKTREFRTDYYTEVTRADADMGALYDFVRAKLGPNTIFLFSSDHGAQWPFGKWNLYETSIRTPLVASWPGVIQPGTRTDAMVSWVDLGPTLIELAGGRAPAEWDGRSFAGVLLGRTSEHRTEIFTTHSGDGRMNVYPIRSVRTGRFHYIRNLFPQYEHTTWIDRAQDVDGLAYWRTWVEAARIDPAAAQIVRRYHERPAEELYDVLADPAEANNLADDPAQAGMLKSLREKVEAWMKEQGDTGRMFEKPYPTGTPELPPPAAGAGP